MCFTMWLLCISVHSFFGLIYCYVIRLLLHNLMGLLVIGVSSFGEPCNVFDDIKVAGK